MNLGGLSRERPYPKTRALLRIVNRLGGVNAKKELRILTDRSATGRRAILRKYDVLPTRYWRGNA
jgi:hypothetical protein